MKNIKKLLALLLVGVMSFTTLSLTACNKSGDSGENETNQSSVEEASGPIILKNVTQAKNVILLIGDGMGPEQIKAGEHFKGEKLSMQNFPYMTQVETRSASDAVTDSAAAATALATGNRTTNGMVGMDAEGNTFETIVDIAHNLGKRTGIIATEELNGATPMGFSAHADARGKTSELLESAATSSNVNLFASYLIPAKYQNFFKDEGYEKLQIADDISESTSEKVFGSYLIPATYDSMAAEGGYVAFDRLVTEALEYLSKDEDGFFLMAEGSHIDHGGHENNICYMLEELIAFDNAVQAVLEWAKNRDDTVVIVTADHETGGLSLQEGTTHEEMQNTYDSNGQGTCYSWGTKGHTGVDVNLYINGANIDFSKYSFETKERIKNTDVFEIMKDLFVGE